VTINLSPETEQLVAEELQSGHLDSIDELIVEGVHVWREKQNQNASNAPQRPKKSLSEFFRESPLVGLELEFERSKDTGRGIEL